MKLVQRYYNCENECIETLDTLRDYFENILPEEERHETTFEEFVENCCDKNGALTPVPDEYTGRLFYDFQHGDVVSKRIMWDRLEREYGFDEFTHLSEMWDYCFEIERKEMK